jgi:hypothetical protein
MKTRLRFAALVSLSLALLGAARAADIDGQWIAEFESQVGHTKCVFVLKADGEKLTGKAITERAQLGKTETEITAGKIAQGEVAFTETVKIQDREVVIEYKGTLVGDELKLHRKVVDLADYDIVAKRVKVVAK